MTDEELKELVAGLAIAQQKNEIQFAKNDAKMAKAFAETDAKMAKTDAKLNKIATLIGNIANNQGDSAEEFFYRSLIAEPYLGKVHFDTIYRNLPANKNKLQDEFDIVLVNENSVAIVEVKQKAHPKLIDDMLTRKLPNFRTLFPYYKELKLYGVIASMVSNKKLIEKAKEAGLFFLTQQGNHVVLVNDKAKIF
ncbi:MAG: hypothetical protein QM487_13315 [Candidatus Marithrix sp.]